MVFNNLLSAYFLKAPGVFKPNFYSFIRIQKAAIAVLKQFPENASPQEDGFRKPLELKFFADFCRVSAGSGNPSIAVQVDFGNSFLSAITATFSKINKNN